MATMKCVGIVGCGDYGRAVGSRLITSSYQIVFGSRDSGRRQDFVGEMSPKLRGVPVVSIEECVSRADIIILAINARHHHTLKPQADHLSGKVLVDISNPENPTKDESQAERVQAMYPSAKVCKAFNTVSAYTLGLEKVTGGSSVVYVSSDHPDARRAVVDMALDMGLQSMEFGGLKRARQLEQAQQSLFAGWGWPTLFTFLWFTFWIIYITCNNFVLGSWGWERWPINNLNRVTGCMAITMLSMCYVPGCIAAFLQLARGTKYQTFPAWLDTWLKMRKQLGLYGLLFGVIHPIMSLGIMEPVYFYDWFLHHGTTVPANATHDMEVALSTRMTWLGETTLLLGILTVTLYAILGITSLPSVGSLMNWREWRFIQTYLGHLCLFLAGAHVCVMCFSWWASLAFVDLIQTPPLLAMIFPVLALFCRLILWTPCVSAHLWKIRGGYVRGQTPDVEKGSSYRVQASVNRGYVETVQL